MPRKKNVELIREVLPDPKYGSRMVSKFINGLMWAGKRNLAERIFYDALDIVARKTGEEPLTVFKKAVENVKPTVQVRPRRVGGATYQVPTEVPPRRRVSLAIRWMVGATRKRKERTMTDRLASEILDALNNAGETIKKKQDTHRMAEANKAFAHYRW